VDVQQYRVRRGQALQNLAARMAERVEESGRAVALEAMPAAERRIIHLALRDHSKVTTQSIGEGENRKVMILPKE
jgi:spoIIIJ-associated protein